MNRLSAKTLLLLILLVFSIFFSYFTGLVENDLNRLNALLKYSSLNTYLFYQFKESFFMNFDFNGIHPFFLSVTFLAKIFSLKTALILHILIIPGMFLYLIQNEILDFHEIILWLISIPFLFSFNAAPVLLWIQYLAAKVFKNLTRKQFGGFQPIYLSMFYSALSIIFLPGILLLFLLEIVQTLCTGINLFRSRDVLLYFTTASIIIPGIHILLAVLFFGISPDNLAKYLLLPAGAYTSGFYANNEVFIETFLKFVWKNKTLLLGIPLVAGFSAMSREWRSFGIKTCISVLILLTGSYLTKGNFAVFVFMTFFIWIMPQKNLIISFNQKTTVLSAVLIFILVNFLEKIPDRVEPLKIMESDIIISPRDFSSVSFNDENLKSLKIVDLKIIPDNAAKLINDIRSSKIEPFLNPYIMKFLEEELKYGHSIFANLENKKYTIYLKSRFHPDNEMPPYRRVYQLWNQIKEYGGKLILF